MHKSCESGLTWGKMRSIARETAFQIALRNCSKEVGGKVSVIYMIVKWSEGGRVCAVKHIFFGRALVLSWGADVTINDFSAFLGMGRCKNWAHKSSPENTSLKTCSVFPSAQSISFFISTLNPLQGVMKVCSGSRFSPCRASWQVPVCSWQYKRGNLDTEMGTERTQGMSEATPS